jgi:hypothetical protein
MRLPFRTDAWCRAAVSHLATACRSDPSELTPERSTARARTARSRCPSGWPARVGCSGWLDRLAILKLLERGLEPLLLIVPVDFVAGPDVGVREVVPDEMRESISEVSTDRSFELARRALPLR